MSAFIQGGGDVFGPAGAVDGEPAVFNGATGKILKAGPTIGDIVQIKTIYRFTQINNNTVIIPVDGSKPQSNEGLPVFVSPLSITPRYANSLILLQFTAVACHTAASATGISCAIFRSGLADTIGAATAVSQGSSMLEPISFQTVDFPGVTTSLDYSVRFGGNSTAHISVIGGRGDMSVFTGAVPAVLTVFEIRQ